MKKLTICLLILSIPVSILFGQVKWERISSQSGAIEIPNTGKQQTSSAVADFDNDGINDFCISE